LEDCELKKIDRPDTRLPESEEVSRVGERRADKNMKKRRTKEVSFISEYLGAKTKNARFLLDKNRD